MHMHVGSNMDRVGTQERMPASGPAIFCRKEKVTTTPATTGTGGHSFGARVAGGAGTAVPSGLEAVALASCTQGLGSPDLRPTPTPRGPGSGGAGPGGAQPRTGLCGREEHGAQPRPLVTRCHLLLPRRRQTQTIAAQGKAGAGSGPGEPKAAPLLTPTAPRPHSACPSLLGDSRRPAACPAGSLPSSHHLLHVPSHYLPNASFFQEARQVPPPPESIS